jgi:hypothetical protein
MAMDQHLAQHFGNTVKTASEEDLQKQAAVELFHKLANAAQIDISNLGDEEMRALWDGTIGKLASEGKLEDAMKAMDKKAEFPPAKDKDDKKKDEKKEEEEKKAAAEAEFLQKRAAAEKVAEAEMMGRTMAHAYVAELREIAKTAGAMPPAFLANIKGKDDKDGDKDKETPKDDDKEKDKKATAAKVASEMPNLDDLAHERAVKIAADAKFDPEEAGQKVAAVRILGLLKSDGTKVAAAQNADHAISLRALEFLEVAGYPVTWDKA